MSYARWSSKSDVYVFEHTDGGYVTHVAKRRHVVPPIPSAIGSRWFLRLCQWVVVRPYPFRFPVIRLAIKAAEIWDKRIHKPSLRLIPVRKIGLPMDGKSYWAPEAEHCAIQLRRLRSFGYRVPQSAIDALEEDAKDV